MAKAPTIIRVRWYSLRAISISNSGYNMVDFLFTINGYKKFHAPNIRRTYSFSKGHSNEVKNMLNELYKITEGLMGVRRILRDIILQFIKSQRQPGVPVP